MTLYVLPALQRLNTSDCARRHSVLFCDDRLESGVGSYGHDLSLGKFRESVVLSNDNRLPALGSHVGDILGLGAYKQMRWIDTVSHVAAVQYAQASRYRPIVMFPREAMRQDELVVKSEIPVSIEILYRRPEPARIGLLDLLKKSFVWRPVPKSLSTLAGTATLPKLVDWPSERESASGTVLGKVLCSHDDLLTVAVVRVADWLTRPFRSPILHEVAA